MPIHLDDQELAAVLAGLRMIQQAFDRYGVLPYGIMDIYTNGAPGPHEPTDRPAVPPAQRGEWSSRTIVAAIPEGPAPA